MKTEQRIYNGNVYYEAFYNDQDQLHNDNGPAIIEKHKFKLYKINEMYFTNGHRHRAGGMPADISFYENGKVREMRYIENGTFAQLPSNRPNVECFYDNGKPQIMLYFNTNGSYHNMLGAANIRFDINSQITNEDYCINGKVFSKADWAKEVIRLTTAAGLTSFIGQPSSTGLTPCSTLQGFTINKEKTVTVIPNNICKKCHCKDDYLGETGLCYKCFQP